MSNHTNLTPAQPGNELAVKHGVYSSSWIEARAAEVREELMTFAPWLDRPEYLPAIHRWLRVEARALLGHEWIEQVTARSGFGKVSTRLLETVNGTDRLAGQLGAQLGLDPAGRAAIMSLVAGTEVATANLATLAEKGREIIARRDRELATQADQDDNATS